MNGGGGRLRAALVTSSLAARVVVVASGLATSTGVIVVVVVRGLNRGLLRLRGSHHGGGSSLIRGLRQGSVGVAGASSRLLARHGGLRSLRGLGLDHGSHSRAGLLLNIVAGEIEERLAVGIGDGKIGCGRGGGVLKNVPPDVHFTEARAASVLPEVLSILVGGLGLVLSLAADGPASLSDPDGLATGSGGSLIEGILEQVVAVLNAVGLGVLKVGVSVHAEPVAGVNEGLVGLVDVGSPGVDVADGDVLEARSLDGLANLVDVADEGLGASTGVGAGELAGGSLTVEVLTTNGDTGNKFVELTAVLVNGLLEGSNLLVESLLASRGPETEEQAGLGADGGGNGGDGLVGSAVLDHGVETSAGKGAIGAGEVGGSLEIPLKVSLGLALAVVVETLESSAGRGDGRGEGQEGR